MRLKNFFLITFLVINKNVFAAEAGMPQLNPEYWASQTFWLLIFFVVLYMTASRFFIPKIIELSEFEDDFRRLCSVIVLYFFSLLNQTNIN